MGMETVKQLDALRQELETIDGKVKTKVLVCGGTGCMAQGAEDVYESIIGTAEKAGIQLAVSLTDCAHKDESVLASLTGCQGFCQAGPLVTISPMDVVYTKVSPSHSKDIVEKTVVRSEVIEKLLYTDPDTKQTYRGMSEIPFYRKQQFVALRGCGRIGADSFHTYLAAGGFKALSQVLAMSGNQVIETIESSGLRGRGGGGFLTGKKWRACVNAPGDDRYVICNGDEGDPGAFMDCCIMEGDPYRIIEGMIICAHGIGAKQGYVYVRNEYPKAVERLGQAIDACFEQGLLGERILGSDLSFSISIVRGGGAFVCGESTALMRSIEGNVGEPRAKYIRSVVRGLNDKPTVLNNVETFACVPTIIEKGADWFAGLGTTNSAGTKAFCLVGKVKNTGLIEVPMGTTLREVVYDIGNGILDNRPFKAVQTGGPSGGCLSESQLDLPVDFDALTHAGSMMGSGGMIVMDDRTCMVDVAKYFLKFLIEESCGKCVPCREGVYQLHELLDSLTRGEGQPGDLERIERLAEDIQISSLCGLGKSAPNPVLSTLKNFRDEYNAHIQQKKCPAGVCRALTQFTIDSGACTGCMVCLKSCPADAIAGTKKEPHIIDQEKCTRCGACRTVCKYDAVVTG